MNDGQSAWLLLFLLGIVLVIIGLQGNLGTLIAVVFCPAYIDTHEGGGSS